MLTCSFSLCFFSDSSRVGSADTNLYQTCHPSVSHCHQLCAMMTGQVGPAESAQRISVSACSTRLNSLTILLEQERCDVECCCSFLSFIPLTSRFLTVQSSPMARMFPQPISTAPVFFPTFFCGDVTTVLPLVCVGDISVVCLCVHVCLI